MINLKTILRINSWFSGLSGLAMLLFNGQLINLMQIQASWILPVIGSGLILFAAYLWLVSSRQKIKKWEVKSIIAQDFLWVLASLGILLFQAYGLSYAGYLIIGIIALIVADFAILQMIGLRKM
ncbi:MAG: hypothetical protein GYB31_20605 [Bacteroidetes bacterium]|nr:hypothetical protein [Bacteroidota bacterium]